MIHLVRAARSKKNVDRASATVLYRKEMRIISASVFGEVGRGVTLKQAVLVVIGEREDSR